MAFRLRVDEILKEKKITTGKLSRGADIPISTVRRMVKEPTYQPRLDTLAKAARYLGVSVDDLYYDDGTSPIKPGNTEDPELSE
jgi:DNA-binding Xre family transcriptional regulator